MSEVSFPVGSPAFRLVFEVFLLGMFLWLVPSMLVAVGAFPRFVAGDNRFPRLLRTRARRRSPRSALHRAAKQLAPVHRAGLSLAASRRVLLLEAHRPILAARIGAGRLLLYALSVIPLVILFLDEEVRSLPVAQVDAGVVVLLVLASLVPPLVFLSAAVLADGRINRLWPLEMLVWIRFRDLLADETSPEPAEAGPQPWWRWNAARRARNLSSLVEVLELDLLDFRGSRRDESRVVPGVMGIVATFEQYSDGIASNPGGQLDTAKIVKALDAWVLGDWEKLPPTEPTPAILAFRSSRSSRARHRITVGLSVLLLLGIVVGVYFAFGRTQSSAALGSVASVIAGVLINPLKLVLERRRTDQR